ncbi:MAG TPA: SH3 domain-containing protein [Alphaproteobacteria bacterium]|nr:SH3 domain-containing protein [Alphaproteobacteria bacterium]
MSSRLSVLLALLAALSLPAGPASADSGLPVPRFVTLGSDEINVRTGPGSRYPVDWVFVRRNLPVEIVAEFDTWRRIRDVEGTEGWVHQAMLSGRRSLVVTGPDIRDLRAEPSPSAATVARAEPGVVGRLLRCPAEGDAGAGWCYAEIGGYRGWIARSDIWGIYPGEVIE